MMSVRIGTLVVLTLTAAIACKKDEQPPPTTAQGFQAGQTGQPAPQGQPATAAPTPAEPAAQPQAGQASVQPGQAGQPPAAGQPQPGQVPQLGAVVGDPQALQNVIAGALAGAAANLGALTGGELGPIEAGIKMKAQTDAKGMKPAGDLQSAKLAQGGHAAGSLTLDPGGCYSIVGFGGLGVFVYQINVITAPPLPPQVLAQSTGEKNDPTVGPNEQCVRNPFPLPMLVKVDMHVIKGQGLVGAQAYKK